MLRTLCIFVAISLAVARKTPFYRRDYEYVEDYDSFYKLHGDQVHTFNSAFIACKNEGAELFYPESPEEWRVVQNLVQPKDNTLDITFIYVGIHNQFGMDELITVDGRPTPLPIPEDSSENGLTQNKCVLMNTFDGTFVIYNCESIESAKPFVCKKKMPQNPCPNIDSGYKYEKETQKCYKFNRLAQTWNAAMQTCFMEGGSLLIMNSLEEVEVIKRLYRRLIYNSNNRQSCFVGYRKLYDSNEFFTVRGKSILENFFYGNTDRDREYVTENENCGSVSMWENNENILRSSNCDIPKPFICEIDA